MKLQYLDFCCRYQLLRPIVDSYLETLLQLGNEHLESMHRIEVLLLTQLLLL